MVDRVVCATPRGPFVLFVVSVGVANLQLVRQQANSLQEEHRQGAGGGKHVRSQKGSRRIALFDARTIFQRHSNADDVASAPRRHGLLVGR